MLNLSSYKGVRLYDNKFELEQDFNLPGKYEKSLHSIYRSMQMLSVLQSCLSKDCLSEPASVTVKSTVSAEN